MIDTDFCIVTSIDSEVTTALRAAIFTTPRSENSNKPICGIGGTTKTVVAIQFWFYFWGNLYSVRVHTLPGDPPLFSVKMEELLIEFLDSVDYFY